MNPSIVMAGLDAGHPCPPTVMAGLVPAIHADPLLRTFKRGCNRTTWMAGTSPAMTLPVIVWSV
jgi:hypothetical protein